MSQGLQRSREVLTQRRAPKIQEEPLVSVKEDFSSSAYPNPFSGEVTIDYVASKTSKKAELTVTEAGSGKIVFRAMLGAGTSKTVLDEDLFSKGLYICSIVTDEGNIKHFKLVKM